MPAFKITNVDPLPHGTPVFDVTGGQHNQIGLSIDWNAKPAPAPQGCPQWIDTINVAQDLGSAQKGHAQNPVPPDPFASSSLSSRNVNYQSVDQNGNVTPVNNVPYVLIAAHHYIKDAHGDPVINPKTGKACTPLADEIWFSYDTPPTGLVGDLMIAIEGGCKSQPATDCTQAQSK
jgi:hypothetical protein